MNAAKSRWRSAAMVVGGLILLSVIAGEPPAKQAERAAASDNGDGELASGDGGSTGEGATEGGTATGPGGAAASGTGGGGTGTAAKNPKGLECKAGQNGGETDKGVS